MPDMKLNISKLTAQKSGNFAILIDRKVFGEISADPLGEFVIPEGVDESNKPVATVLPAGTHNYLYKGKALKVEVKSLKMDFMPFEDDNNNLLAAKQMKLSVGEYIERAKKHNEKALEEVLARVTVTEA